MIRLIIKGTIDDAAKGASMNGIALKNVVHRGDYNETFADCDTNGDVDIWNKIIVWFNEDNGLNPPYPPGSLLFYKEVKDG